jgi:type IV secretion system protein VirD4
MQLDAIKRQGSRNGNIKNGELGKRSNEIIADRNKMSIKMEVKEDNDDFLNAVDYMFLGLTKRKPNCFAVRQYQKYKLSSGKTAKSILISCGARLAPFDISELREIMSYDEMELNKIGDRKTAAFFIISDTNTTYNFIVALAFDQMMNLLCERADNKYGGRLPHHVRFLWDEAANTGQVPHLEKLVAVIRSREISLCLFLQAQSQLISALQRPRRNNSGEYGFSYFSRRT